MPSDSSGNPTRDLKTALRWAWQFGVLEYKFRERPQQLLTYQEIRATWEQKHELAYALVIHRQWGKSRLLCVMGLEECSRKPHTRVLYLTDTKHHADTIVVPLVLELIADCPKDLRPTYIKHQKKFVFPNGSEFILFGADMDSVDKGRGLGAVLLLVDEAGFVDQVREALATYLPVLAVRGGFCLLSSTPPPVPAHPFEKLYRELEAKACGKMIPLSKNPDATPAMRTAAEQYRQLMGEEAYLREWECKWGVNDDNRIVVPEFGRIESQIVKNATTTLPYPENADHYVGFDPGGRDHHGLVFGTWNDSHRYFQVEDEIFVRKLSTADLARLIRDKELELWGAQPFGRVRRYSDASPQLLFDLQSLHGLRFTVTRKDDKKGTIQNLLRVMLNSGEIYVDPRCRKLVQTLHEARWEKNFKSYVRDKDGADLTEQIGHADLLDALLYLLRNVTRHRPAPKQSPSPSLLANTPKDPRNQAALNPYRGQKPPSENARKVASFLRRHFKRQ